MRQLIVTAFVFPLLLGAVARLISVADKDVTRLDLVEHETYENGVQKLVLEVAIR